MPSTSTPKVSVGLPVYNGETTMSRAVESVLGQTFGDLELVISDNCSTDGTEELCRTYMALDDRIRYDRPERNLGLARNFSRLPGLARGEYFKWIARDDLIYPEFIARSIEIAETDDDIITVAPTVDIVREDGEVVSQVTSYVHHGPWADDRLAQHRQMMDEIGYCERHGGLLFIGYVYGFHRRARLMQTRLLLPFISSDLVLAGELALWGRLVKLDEALNTFTLNESKSSTTANFVNWDPGAVQRILDPDKDSKWDIAWSQRARHLEHVRGAARAPFGPAGKARAMFDATRPFRQGQMNRVTGLLDRFKRVPPTGDAAPSA